MSTRQNQARTAFDTSSSLTLLHVKTHRTASTLHTLTASLFTKDTHALRFASVNASRFSRARLRIDTSTRRHTCCRDPCLFRKHLEHDREPLASDHQSQDKLLVRVHDTRHGVLEVIAKTLLTAIETVLCARAAPRMLGNTGSSKNNRCVGSNVDLRTCEQLWRDNMYRSHEKKKDDQEQQLGIRMQ